jgi:hypothetical protein
MNTENNNNTNAMELNEKFRLPAIVGGEEFTSDELAEEMDGLHLNFQRVKIPAGGSLQFELPGDDPENPEYARTLEGVIIYNHAANALWIEGSEEEENATPLCSSVDGKFGCGEPGGDCATCDFNKFGSGENGKGKMCKNMRFLYLLRDGEYMPMQIILPPTSIKPFNDFYNQVFATRRRGTCGSIVSIGLKRVDNGSNTYSITTFKKLSDFSGEQLAHAKMYSDNFKEQIKAINQQRAIDIINRSNDDNIGYDANGGNSSESGKFIIGANIDGDRDELPA